MKRVSGFLTINLLFLVALFQLVGCGSDDKKAALTAENPTSPESTPIPKTPTSSSLKWTQAQIDESTMICANKGSERYQSDRWEVFCRCAYTAAAQKWTFDEFFTNFNQNYEVLYQQQTIQKCLKDAGLA